MYKKILFVMITAVVFAGSAFAGNLKVKVYNPGTDAIFQITSTLIYGDKDAILIDAQFEKKYALELIKEIKATGKNLKTVYISHSDPDFYFTLDEIKKAFPKADIISTAQTAYLIDASKEGKLAVWKDQLKDGAPSEFIVPKAVKEIPDLEGYKIEIIQAKNDPAHSFVWIPSLKTIVGGISVGTDAHLWMADTKNVEALDLWLAQIDKMKSLNPEKVIASHFIKLNDSPKILDFVKDYLLYYKEADAQSKNADELTKKTLAKYPGLGAVNELELGAKVFKGEVDWELKSPYLAIGNHISVDFGGDFKFDLDFEDNKSMRFTGLIGSMKGLTELINYTAVEVSPNVFMVYWSEPQTTKANVVHVQNWNTGVVYTNIANPDGSFYNLKGTFKLKD